MSQRQRKSPPPPGNSTNEFWISVSDLMSNLIFIFIILLIVFSLQFRKEQESLKLAKTELQNPTLTRQFLLQNLQEHLQKLGVKVAIFPEDGILRLSESALKFPSGRAFPDEETLVTVGHLAQILTEQLSCFTQAKSVSTQMGTEPLPSWCPKVETHAQKDCSPDFNGRIETVMIEGHTDALAVRQGAPYKDNLALSAARATTILRLMALCEPRILDLFNSQNRPVMGVSGYSYLRPVIKDKPDDERNRRIDVRFVMELPDIALEKISQSNSDIQGMDHDL